jgi:hypothetical protein
MASQNVKSSAICYRLPVIRERSVLWYEKAVVRLLEAKKAAAIIASFEKNPQLAEKFMQDEAFKAGIDRFAIATLLMDKQLSIYLKQLLLADSTLRNKLSDIQVIRAFKWAKDNQPSLFQSLLSYPDLREKMTSLQQQLQALIKANPNNLDMYQLYEQSVKCLPPARQPKSAAVA